MTHIHLQPGRPGGQIWLVPFVPGVAFLAFGIAIVVWPELLVAAVATLCILLGLTLASLGWRLRSGGLPPIGPGGFGGFGGPAP